jgi:hypothetical protein
MAWSTEFKERISSNEPIAPCFAIDFETSVTFDSNFSDYSPRKPTLHTHAVSYGSDPYPSAITNFTGGSQKLSIGNFSTNAAGLRVSLAGVEVADFIAKHIPRGQPCMLRIGFEDLPYMLWGRYGPFMYEGLSGRDNRWTMKLGGTFKVLQNNLNALSKTSGIFIKPGTITRRLGDAITTGDPFRMSVNGTALYNWIFEEEVAGGPIPQEMAVKFGEGETTYYAAFKKWLIPRPGVLEDGSLDDIRFGTGMFGKDRPSIILAGTKMTFVNWINGTIPDIFKKFISGSQTPHPDRNIGVGPDLSDFEIWSDRFNRYGGFHANLFTENHETNAISYLQNFLSQWGAFVVSKEGAPAFRFAQDLSYSAGIAPEIDYEINEDDIISMDSYSVYNPDVKYQSTSETHTIEPGTTTESRSIVTMPAKANINTIVDQTVFNSGIGGGIGFVNKAAESQAARLNNWRFRIPDEMSLNLAGWKWLSIVPGDLCSISCSVIPDFSRTDSSRVHPLERQTFMVTSVNPNWNDASCTLDFTRIPRIDNPYK